MHADLTPAAKRALKRLLRAGRVWRYSKESGAKWTIATSADFPTGPDLDRITCTITSLQVYLSMTARTTNNDSLKRALDVFRRHTSTHVLGPETETERTA